MCHLTTSFEHYVIEHDRHEVIYVVSYIKSFGISTFFVSYNANVYLHANFV